MEPQAQNTYRANDIIIPWLVFALTLLIVGFFIAYFLYQEHANIETRTGMAAQRTTTSATIPNPLVETLEQDVLVRYADWRRAALFLCGLYVTFGISLAMGLYLHQRRQRDFQQLTIMYDAELRHNAERLKLATEAAGMGVWDYDLETGRLTWDDAMFSIYGQDPAKFSSTYEDWRGSLVPEDLAVAEADLHAAVNRARQFNTSFRIIRGDGEMRTIRGVAKVHCNEDGKPMRIIGINEDITVRQKEQEVLREKERFMKALTDVIPGMVGYWNRDMRCTFANKEYLTWFGKSPDEMIGIQIKDLLGEELFRQYEPYIHGAMKGDVQRFQRIMTKFNGEVGHTWAHYIPDIDGDQVRGFYVLISDITELKQTQLQLEELNEALKQRTEEVEQAFRSKSKFMSTVAHEFRTPLSLLVSSIDILDRYGVRLTKERRAEQNGHIRSAARQMSNLIDSVLSFNCLETDRPSNSPVLMDVGQVCRAIAGEVKTVWGAGYEFDILISADCGSAMLDEILFRRVLENLLTNAFRYTPEGGTVSLRVNRDSDSLRIEITDSGIGISEEDQGRIFEAFYRGGNVEARRGLGLGLSIVREALLHMGGNMIFTSRIGEGTTMQVEIPVTGA